MTLAETIKVLEGVAMEQPAVNMIVRNDVFRINAAPSVKYGVFAWLQREHRYNVGTDSMHYSFTLFYVDRLTEDGGNEIDIQSTGISTLTNIIKALGDYDIETDEDYYFTAFNQRFLDVCAGVYCNVGLDVPASPCAEGFPDFGGSFSNDFQIF